jgi:hypothetical protein
VRALVVSPYPQLSIVFGFLTWLFGVSTFDPAGLTISIIPNLLGFTVGALAIILAFSSSSLFSILAEDGNSKSLFMKVIANFLHFITIQVITILTAILYFAFSYSAIKLASSIFLVYSILTTLSTGVQLFEMAAIANMWEAVKKHDDAGKTK